MRLVWPRLREGCRDAPGFPAPSSPRRRSPDGPEHEPDTTHDHQGAAAETRPRARDAALRRRPRGAPEELPRIQAGTCRACRPTSPSRRTRCRRSCARSTGRARASTWRRCPSSRSSTRTSGSMPPKKRQDWIWDKIIYANPNKPVETLEELNQYKPLVTFDNAEELLKIRKHAPQAGRGAAHQGGQHRRHGGALLEVRRGAGRGGGPDPAGREARA